MYARAVDDAASRLGELRREEREDLGLASLALGLAVVATQVRPELVVPLFIGGLAVGAFGLRALWRRWELVDRLAGEPDAYVISEVRAYASREAGSDKRHGYAAWIRSKVLHPEPALAPRIAAAATELEALAGELDDEDLRLDPACAVACQRLLTDLAASPLLNPGLPADDLRSRVIQIRAGFSRRGLDA